MQWTEYSPGDDQLRGAVMHAIEEASGRPLHVSDPLPDELIATVQALQPTGCSLGALEKWIRFADHSYGWSTRAFAFWFGENYAEHRAAQVRP